MKIASILALAFVTFTGLSFQLRAETPSAEEEREAKEAEEEAAKENNLFPEVTLKGMVTLSPLNEEGKIPVVAGKIAEKTGREILLKLTDPKNQRAKLLKAGAKDVQLQGYYRNAQKYLVVTGIVDPLEQSVPPGPREGL